MTPALVSDLARNAMMITALVAAPMLAVALAVGLLVSVFQTVTQIQEQTLSFVPKLIAVGLTFLVALPWMLQLLVEYTAQLIRSMPGMVA